VQLDLCDDSMGKHCIGERTRLRRLNLSARKLTNNRAQGICAGVISLVLFAAIRQWDMDGPIMTPERFDGSGFVIKIAWGVRLLLAWAEFSLTASISQHLAGCQIMRAPYLLGITAV
jgi:hypothetical protein